MDLLKKVLRHALTAQAQRVKLTSDALPELVGAGGRQLASDGLPAPTRADLAALFDFLFPTDAAAIAAQQPTRGTLNVPNVGKIQLIAQPGQPASLRLYLPPGGQEASDVDWNRLLGTTYASEPPVMAAAAPLATSSSVAVPPMAMPEQPLFAPVTPKPPPPVSPTAAILPATILPPTPPSAPATIARPPVETGYIPPILPEIARPPAAAAPSPMPAAAPPALGFASQLDQGFAPSFESGAMHDDMPVFAPRHRQTPASSSPETDVVIDYGPDVGGMSAKSQGQNAIDTILTDMVQRRASDLHMTCGEAYCFRIDGDIQRVGDAPVDPPQMRRYLDPILPERNRREFHAQNDTDFAYELEGVGRFRVNIFRDKNGVGTVMRHIPSKILTSEQLGLPPAITRFCGLSKGLVLVTGPTGSGKSTTLAAMIDLINRTRSDHVLTIEDPIEFVHPQQRCLINQREVHKHTDSFARALKAALREDPDIVLIGEMRDLETIAIAIETAETGHLVFGTLHTTTAVSTVDRIIDQFPSDQQEQIRMMLAASLRGVVAQTLLKRKGGGRIAAHEILVTNDAVSAMIREGKNHMIANHMQGQKQDGNQLLNEMLLKYVKDGLVDADEAYRKAVDKSSLADAFRRLNISVPGMAPPAAGSTGTARPGGPGQRSA